MLIYGLMIKIIQLKKVPQCPQILQHPGQLNIKAFLWAKLSLNLPFLCTIKSKHKWFLFRWISDWYIKWLQHQILVFCSISLKSVGILLSFMKLSNTVRVHTVFNFLAVYLLLYFSHLLFFDWSTIKHKSRVWHPSKEVKWVFMISSRFFYQSSKERKEFMQSCCHSVNRQK